MTMLFQNSLRNLDSIFFRTNEREYTFGKVWAMIRHMRSFLSTTVNSPYLLVDAEQDPLRVFVCLVSSFYLDKTVCVFAGSSACARFESILNSLNYKFDSLPDRIPPDLSLQSDLVELEDNFSYPSGPKLVLLTSGSSGPQKGVVHSCDSLAAAAKAANDFFDLDLGDNWLLSLGADRVGGLMILMRCFLAGASVSYGGGRKTIEKDLLAFKPSCISLVPTQLHDCLSSSSATKILEKMKLILVGGAGISESDYVKAKRANIRLTLSYGLSETGAVCASLHRSTISRSHRDIGYPLPGWTFKLDHNNRLRISGEGLFIGYLDETGLRRTEKKYFLTNDRICENENGTYQFVDRSDLVFQTGGNKVSPLAIEQVLDSAWNENHLIVVGLDDHRLGKVPALVISGLQRPKIKDLDFNCFNLLEPYARPRKVLWNNTDESKQKPNRHQIQQKADAGRLEILWENEY